MVLRPALRDRRPRVTPVMALLLATLALTGVLTYQAVDAAASHGGAARQKHSGARRLLLPGGKAVPSVFRLRPPTWPGSLAWEAAERNHATVDRRHRAHSRGIPARAGLGVRDDSRSRRRGAARRCLLPAPRLGRAARGIRCRARHRPAG